MNLYFISKVYYQTEALCPLSNGLYCCVTSRNVLLLFQFNLFQPNHLFLCILNMYVGVAAALLAGELKEIVFCSEM